MAENGVDYAVVRNAEDEFVDADAREEAVLGEQTSLATLSRPKISFRWASSSAAREHTLAALNISTG
jgi:hypothetical protein